ncbi:hypothetical protein AeNC1_015138, partial [Aphanomyces euteiches]
MTVDVRAVNAQTETIQWPMPLLEVVLDQLQGAQVFFSVDFFKGYWQLPLHEESQEYFSILTDEGVYTPTRVLMGGSDSVAYCQAVVQELLADKLYRGLMAWLDDILGYARSDDDLLVLLEGTLAICAKKGPKLNPKKCEFYRSEVKWCGRIISKSGVRHDPGRIQALMELPEPQRANELQQFVCALNWMRMSIPGYNKIVAPLMDCLERAYAAADGRTKSKMARISLDQVTWGDIERACLTDCKCALARAVELAHVDRSKTICVFADASEKFWRSAITQIPSEHLHRPLESQDHEPLMFLSGKFTGASTSWAIVEKEAFTIVETVKRADYLLQRQEGFQLFPDHRKLRYIFDPVSVVGNIPKYRADKLQRWSIFLMGYQYCINHISGEDNVWADRLSRWRAVITSICAVKCDRLFLSPQMDINFCWPTDAEIRGVQSQHELKGTVDKSGL